MRKSLVRLALAAVALAILATAKPAFATGCPSNIVVGGTMACHLTSGSDCRSCTYSCDDGESYTWNVCNPQ